MSAQPYYLQEPYVYLLNPDLLPNDISIIKGFPVSRLLFDFIARMKVETDNNLNFRLLGNSLASSVRIHRNKIELAIKHHLQIEKREARRKERELEKSLDFKKSLAIFPTGNPLVPNRSFNKTVFFEELLVLFEKDTELQERKRMKAEQATTGEIKHRRRRLTADGLENFEYAIDFNLIEIHVLIEEIYRIVLMHLHSEDEVKFEEVMETHLEKMNLGLRDRVQVERVRMLLCVLYLIQDHRLEAWEDVDTFGIFIKVPPGQKPNLGMGLETI
ncbi:MAG TPA: hypothetical protein VJ044_11275 [Candidatus Hodarchaeales archaeon]|nr:hypothetical protein [Candidatus Hodarchaeales archaeon]